MSSSSMTERYENDSFSFFGPLGMAFYDDGNVLEESFAVKISFSSFLTLFMIFGVIGNICTCAVIIRNRSMRTPTNCYLFNLAITDLMTALFVPIEIYMIWIPEFYPFGEVGCRFHYILWDCLSNCSVLTISAFTVERYLVVSKPFLRQKLALKSRVFWIIAVTWIVSWSFCIPYIFVIDLMERKKYVFCFFTLEDNLRVMVLIEVIVFFVMPMTIIFGLYVLIALRLKSTHLKLRSSPCNGNQSRDKAVKMLAAVAASFFICWAPYCIMRVMMAIPKFKYGDYYEVWHVLHYMSDFNGYLSTAVNPILYSLMSRKFREAFKNFLKGRQSSETRNPASSLKSRQFP